MTPEIQSVNLDFTTHCDRRCENCACGIGINRVLQHHPWEYFERAAKALYGIPRVNLVGGEPTFHPRFGDYVPKLKKLFGASQLTMTTNGWGMLRHWDAIRENFDAVEFSDYHVRPDVLAFLQVQNQVPLSVYNAGLEGSNHTPRSRCGSGSPCTRLPMGKAITYADGKIWGCCIAPGIEGAVGIEPDLGWEEYVPPAPCKDCWFSI